MEKSGVMKNMAQFEQVFEDLDVRIEGVTGALDVATASTEDNQAVMDLLTQMQSEQAMGAGNQIG